MKRKRIALALFDLALIGAIIFVAQKYQEPRGNTQLQSDNQAKSAPSVPNPAPNSPNSHTKTDNGGNKPPQWHVLIAWPNGVTVWVIVLTLLAVAWQSLETAGMADIAEKTLLSTMRPKIIIRRITIHRGTDISTDGVADPDPWRFDFDMVNVGQGKARIMAHNFMADRIKDDPHDFRLLDRKRAPFKLEPGQRESLSIPVSRELMETLRLIGIPALAAGYQNTNRLYFWGNAQFIDAVGVAREVSVCRLYDNKSGRFNPVDDPDCEYAD